MTGKNRTGQDRIANDTTGQARTGQHRTGSDITRQDRAGQDRTGQHRTRQDTIAFTTFFVGFATLFSVPALGPVSEAIAGSCFNSSSSWQYYTIGITDVGKFTCRAASVTCRMKPCGISSAAAVDPRYASAWGIDEAVLFPRTSGYRGAMLAPRYVSGCVMECA